jgi:hypothetical protein
VEQPLEAAAAEVDVGESCDERLGAVNGFEVLSDMASSLMELDRVAATIHRRILRIFVAMPAAIQNAALVGNSTSGRLVRVE